MKFFKKRRSGKRCKNNCDSYQVALLATQKLHAQYHALMVGAERYNDILSFSQEGSIILGVSQANSRIVITTLRDAGDQWRTVSLWFLPRSEYDRPVCNMDLKYTSGCQAAYIVDWHCEIEDKGYGSVLMSHLITYLKTANYQYLTGHICPTDFSHKDKLRHFYSKFGFVITDHEDRLRLELKL